MKILIVEDDAVIAEAIARHFSAWDIETRAVEDFKHVLEAFADF